MKALPRFETPMPSFAMMPPPSSEFRDWSHLPDLALSDVLGHLIPCLSSLSAFAATCRPWRCFFLASASTLLPRIPPLLLQLVPDSKSSHLHAFSRLMIPKLITAPLAAFPSTLISSSRGHLILLVRPRGLLLLIDALNSAERLTLPLPSSAQDRQHGRGERNDHWVGCEHGRPRAPHEVREREHHAAECASWARCAGQDADPVDVRPARAVRRLRESARRRRYGMQIREAPHVQLDVQSRPHEQLESHRYNEICS